MASIYKLTITKHEPNAKPTVRHFGSKERAKKAWQEIWKMNTMRLTDQGSGRDWIEASTLDYSNICWTLLRETIKLE